MSAELRPTGPVLGPAADLLPWTPRAHRHSCTNSSQQQQLGFSGRAHLREVAAWWPLPWWWRRLSSRLCPVPCALAAAGAARQSCCRVWCQRLPAAST